MPVVKTKPVIACIDNSPSMRKILEKSLENLAVDLVVFTSASEAWAYLELNAPKLIILSIMLPDKNGLTLLKELRQLPNHQDTQTVVITSKDYAQDRLMAEALGVLEFLAKPTTIQKITDIVAKYT